MMETEEGILVCYGKQLATALGTAEDALRKLRSINKDEFSDLSVYNVHAKEFLNQHRVEFGIARLRDDARLWTEDDMILAAVLVRNDRGREFRRNLVHFIKAHAKRTYAHESDQLMADMRSELAEIRSEMGAARPYLQQLASLASHNLRAQSGTKHLRAVH